MRPMRASPGAHASACCFIPCFVFFFMIFALCDGFEMLPRHQNLLQVPAPMFRKVSSVCVSPLPLRKRASRQAQQLPAGMSVVQSRLPSNDEDTASIQQERLDHLTLDEVVMSFEAVLEQFRGVDGTTEAVQEAELCLKLMATRRENLPLNRCRVAPSSLHGLGVFATRDIKKGEIVTLYPGDAVLQWKDDRQDLRDVKVLFGSHVPLLKQDVKKATSEESRAYEILATDTISVVGDPELCDDMSYVGHIINDGSFCDSLEGRVKYERDTAKLMNAEHCLLRGWSGRKLPVHFFTRAARDIAKDEEILVSYSFGYWLARTNMLIAETAAAAKAAFLPSANEPQKGSGLEDEAKIGCAGEASFPSVWSYHRLPCLPKHPNNQD